MTLLNNSGALRESIEDFLKTEVLRKTEEDRTGRDVLLLETGRAFMDVLVRHEKAQHSEPGSEVGATDTKFTDLLKTYNALNIERRKAELDVELVNHFRK